MKPFVDGQELANNFNEDEAIWRRYEQKRRRRRLTVSRIRLPEEVLDALDWLEAERECREKRYIGLSLMKAEPPPTSEQLRVSDSTPGTYRFDAKLRFQV